MPKRVLLTLPLLMGCGSSAAAAPEPAHETDTDLAGQKGEQRAAKRSTLRVRVHGFKNRKGQVLVALFSSKKGFPDDGDRAAQRVALPVPKGHLEHVFEDLKPGTYAVAVLHDENKNFKMDTGLFGMPEEAYGVSNNVKGRFGPPSFGDAAIRLKPGKVHRVDIKLIYP